MRRLLAVQAEERAGAPVQDQLLLAVGVEVGGGVRAGVAPAGRGLLADRARRALSEDLRALLALDQERVLVRRHEDAVLAVAVRVRRRITAGPVVGVGAARDLVRDRIAALAGVDRERADHLRIFLRVRFVVAASVVADGQIAGAVPVVVAPCHRVALAQLDGGPGEAASGVRRVEDPARLLAVVALVDDESGRARLARRGDVVRGQPTAPAGTGVGAGRSPCAGEGAVHQGHGPVLPDRGDVVAPVPVEVAPYRTGKTLVRDVGRHLDPGRLRTGLRSARAAPVHGRLLTWSGPVGGDEVGIAVAVQVGGGDGAWSVVVQGVGRGVEPLGRAEDDARPAVFVLVAGGNGDEQVAVSVSVDVVRVLGALAVGRHRAGGRRSRHRVAVRGRRRVRRRRPLAAARRAKDEYGAQDEGPRARDEGARARDGGAIFHAPTPAPRPRTSPGTTGDRCPVVSGSSGPADRRARS